MTRLLVPFEVIQAGARRLASTCGELGVAAVEAGEAFEVLSATAEKATRGKCSAADVDTAALKCHIKMQPLLAAIARTQQSAGREATILESEPQ